MMIRRLSIGALLCGLALNAGTLIAGGAGGEKAAGQAEVPSISFLSPREAKAAIVDDSLDPFFALLQTIDMSAKTGSAITGDTLDAQRTECRRRYQEAVRGFTSDEKDFLRWVVGQAHPAVREYYPAVAALPWSFIKTTNQAEGGLAHTRGSHIVLSERQLQQLLAFKRSAPPETVARFAATLLIHEQFHVFQRSHRKLMETLYTEVWGFRRAGKIEGCAWLTKNLAVNPDGPDCSWVFPIKEGQDVRWIWPQVVYREFDGVRRMPGDFRLVAIDLTPTDGGYKVQVDSSGKPDVQNLLGIKEYTAALPRTMSIFHPNETSASVFGEMVVSDSMAAGERGNSGNDALQKFRAWCRANLR